MDDRDAFAMAAMAAMIGNPGKDTYGKAAVKAFPVFAYEWADAMLAVRGDCDEIARLRAEVDALKARIAIRCEFARLLIQKDAMLDIAQGSLEAARAEVEALRADNRHLRGEFEKAWPDAERYRWLKSRAGFHEERDMGPGGDWLMAVGVSIRPAVNTLDAAIDAARAAQGERG